MYAYISGKLEGVAEDAVIIDNHGIGYQILVPSSTLDRLPSVGGEVKVYTYLQVREDAMVLFGFLTKEELELFKRLITVTGIGPKGALAILGTLSVDDLRFAILSGDAKAIAAAPGIGVKTAQRVILDLKDRMDFLEAFEGTAGQPRRRGGQERSGRREKRGGHGSDSSGVHLLRCALRHGADGHPGGYLRGGTVETDLKTDGISLKRVRTEDSMAGQDCDRDRSIVWKNV